MTRTNTNNRFSQTLLPVRSHQHLFFLCIILATVCAMSQPGVKAATLTVSAGGDLQAAFDAAQPGDGFKFMYRAH